MDMTVDQTGKDRQASSIDSLSALGNANVLFQPYVQDAGAFKEEGAPLNPEAQAVQNADLADGNGHGASLMGMVTMTPPMMSLSL